MQRIDLLKQLSRKLLKYLKIIQNSSASLSQYCMIWINKVWVFQCSYENCITSGMHNYSKQRVSARNV